MSQGWGKSQQKANDMDKFFVVVVGTTVLKMNRETGETWALKESTNKWVKVEG